MKVLLVVSIIRVSKTSVLYGSDKSQYTMNNTVKYVEVPRISSFRKRQRNKSYVN